jgi:spore coat protein U-like protein
MLRIIAAAAVFVTAVAPPVALAASSSTTFTVSATVVGSCRVAASNLSFGNYAATAGNSSSSTISVSCTSTSAIPITVQLNQGLNGVLFGSATTRAMSDGLGHTLNYNLFSNSAASTVWADGTAVVSGTANPTASLTVYGKVPGGQSTAPAGNYTDTINVLVTY